MKNARIKTIAALMFCALAAASAHADKNGDALIKAAKKNNAAKIQQLINAGSGRERKR